MTNLPPSLWPALWSAGTRRTWPPRTADEAKLFVTAAKQESLFPLLFDDGGLPDAVTDVLASEHEALQAFAGRGVLLTERIHRLATILNNRQVRFVILKGGAFRHYLYERPHHRPIRDIDILVPDGDMEPVAKLLVASGMTRFYPGTLSSYAPSHHETAVGFGTVVVDLHQRFAQRNRYRIRYESIWQRSVPLDITGSVAARRLSDADALLYLTISSALKHLRPPMLFYVDLWLMLRRNSDCLAEAVDLARRWQTSHAFYAALKTATGSFPEFEPLLTPALRRVLTPTRRAFLDHLVIPDWSHQRLKISRIEQMWTKYCLIDNSLRRARFAAEHLRETLQGYMRSRKRRTGNAAPGVADGAA